MKIELQNLTKRFGDLTAVNDLSVTIEDGEFVTLVGPSGCGKTTTLRMLAGLEMSSEGTILFDEKDVTDLPAQKRDIALVFQDYALYPHMTARRNMSFALEEDDSLTGDEMDRKIQRTAEMLGIEDHLDQRPSELSGGQQQRVALGRSIVRDPEVFLLDEPLSNLDAKLRMKMRAELQKLHQDLGTTMVYVTHDQEEAMTMSDRVIVLDDGEIQQVDEPAVVYNQPTNRFVAEFIGNPSMNFFPCEVHDGRVDADQFSVPLPERAPSSAIELGIRPEDLTLNQGGADGRVEVFERIGSYNIVYVDVDGIDKDVIVQVDATDQYAPGESVTVGVGERFHLFDADGETVYSPTLAHEPDETQVEQVAGAQ